MIVNHATPVHDNFCRCTKCKPGMVGDRSSSLLRVKVGTLGLVAAAAALIAVRATGAA